MLKAWIMFNENGEPEFIDATLTEQEFKSWYLKYRDRGWQAKLCTITPIEGEAIEGNVSEIGGAAENSGTGMPRR